MKRQFGSLLTRSFLGSGTTLTKIEHSLIEELILLLPDSLKKIVETQFNSYNLVQREINGRSLNFYRMSLGVVSKNKKMPKLKMNTDEAKLVSVKASIAEDNKPVHATLTAVAGRVFCVAFNRRIDHYPQKSKLSILSHKKTWRSNFQT